MDFYATLFNLKATADKAASFITKDGRVIFIGGPSAGGGTAGGAGGVPVTAANVAELAQGMNDDELNANLKLVQLEHSELATQKREFDTVFDKLATRNITPEQAVGWLSTYPVKLNAADPLADIGKQRDKLGKQLTDLAPVYRALHDESVFRMREGKQ